MIREDNNKSRVPKCSNIHKTIYIGEWLKNWIILKILDIKDWLKRAVLSASVPI